MALKRFPLVCRPLDSFEQYPWKDRVIACFGVYTCCSVAEPGFFPHPTPSREAMLTFSQHFEPGSTLTVEAALCWIRPFICFCLVESTSSSDSPRLEGPFRGRWQRLDPGLSMLHTWATFVTFLLPFPQARSRSPCAPFWALLHARIFVAQDPTPALEEEYDRSLFGALLQQCLFRSPHPFQLL